MNKIDEKAAELTKELQAMLDDIELTTRDYTLADAIREGSRVTEQKTGGWGNGDNACAMSAGIIAARARGLM